MCSRLDVQSKLEAEKRPRSKSEIGSVSLSKASEFASPRTNSENGRLHQFKNRILASKINALRQRITNLDHFIALTKEFLVKYDEAEVKRSAATSVRYSHDTQCSCSGCCAMAQLCKHKEFCPSIHSTDDPASQFKIKSSLNTGTDSNQQFLMSGSSCGHNECVLPNQLSCLWTDTSRGRWSRAIVPEDKESYDANSHNSLNTRESFSAEINSRHGDLGASTYSAALRREILSIEVIPRDGMSTINFDTVSSDLEGSERISFSDIFYQDAQVNVTSDYFSADCDHSTAGDSEFMSLMASLSKLSFNDFTASSLFQSYCCQHESKPDSNKGAIILSSKGSCHDCSPVLLEETSPALCTPSSSLESGLMGKYKKIIPMNTSRLELNSSESFILEKDHGDHVDQISDIISEFFITQTKSSEEKMDLQRYSHVEEDMKRDLLVQDYLKQCGVGTCCQNHWECWKNSEKISANNNPHNAKSQQIKRVQKGVKVIKKTMKKVIRHIMRKINYP